MDALIQRASVIFIIGYVFGSFLTGVAMYYGFNHRGIPMRTCLKVTIFAREVRGDVFYYTMLTGQNAVSPTKYEIGDLVCL